MRWSGRHAEESFMATPEWLAYASAAIFALALIHTFSTGFFEHLAHLQPRHAGFWHLLGEVEVVFGFWAIVLVTLMFVGLGNAPTLTYLESRNFTEPMFVFVIMVIAGTRPVLQVANQIVWWLGARSPLPRTSALFFLLLALVPLLGSFITEPAAMTLAALMLRDAFFRHPLPEWLKYGALGVLFVNVSIGGTLTPFAAPPVLMVAAQWQWDLGFMISVFGWKAALAVFVNAAVLTALAHKTLSNLPVDADAKPASPVWPVAIVHLIFLGLVVLFAHHPVVFMGVFLMFMGYATAYERHQDRLILREALLVAFFLGGLVVLGGQQTWWLEPVLMSLDAEAVFYGATLLTAVTDNAALTYLGSLVEGLSDEFKVSLVAGAVTGGGLTVIANAPNPAGVAILRGAFTEQTIRPLGLLAAATLPTVVAAMAFRLL